VKPSPWGRLVILSALLVVGPAAALLAWDFVSEHERLVSYPVTGAVSRVVLDVGDADVAVVGGGRQVEIDVSRRERHSFGRSAETRREVAGGVFKVTSRCPDALPDACSVRYRVVVPDSVPVEVTTADGAVRFERYRGSAQVASGGGDIEIEDFCGFALQAQTESGDVDATASCPLQQLSLRTRTGSVHAMVPPGRYEIDAQSASGRHALRGISSIEDAPFAIQALSSSGDVLVEAGS
jgi:Putative adhesin